MPEKITNLIWKYPLMKEDRFLRLPRRAKILSVQAQNNRPCIWVEFNAEDSAETEMREFLWVETAQPFESPDGKRLHYLATVQLLGGDYVAHIYEVKDF